MQGIALAENASTMSLRNVRLVPAAGLSVKKRRFRSVKEISGRMYAHSRRLFLLRAGGFPSSGKVMKIPTSFICQFYCCRRFFWSFYGGQSVLTPDKDAALHTRQQGLAMNIHIFSHTIRGARQIIFVLRADGANNCLLKAN